LTDKRTPKVPPTLQPTSDSTQACNKEGDAKIKEAANATPPLWRCYTAAYAAAATAAALPQPTLSCRCRAAAKLPPHHKAAITTATAVALLQCCHRRRCHPCRATAAATKLLPPHRRQAADVASTAVALLQCCHRRYCHCCRTAAAATKLLPLSCHRPKLPQLPLPSFRCRRAAAKLPPRSPPPSCSRNKTLYVRRNT
jgi:hypothetical protein